MRSSILLLLLYGATWSAVYGQSAQADYEKYPVFPECEQVQAQAFSSCFDQALIARILENFQVPKTLRDSNYEGEITVLFEVNDEGLFKVLNVQTAYEDLRQETQRVFKVLPQIQPATYNSRSTYMQFSMAIQLPLERNSANITSAKAKEPQVVESITDEYESIKTTAYHDNEYASQLNIPFSHQVYSRFDAEMNKVGTNSHTAGKPFVYGEVRKYYNFEAQKNRLLKEKTFWLGRKFWNEHMVTLQGEDYWFTVDPAADLMLGKETADNEDQDFTYNNTRALVFQGGLGKNLNFYTVFYESQGSFAGYFNRYARSLKPDGGNPAIVPGRGVASESRSGDFDYPIATGYLSYSPSTHFNIQLGHGKQFIGDGYRSLLLSDNASPYPFIKLNTTFWKFKYTNTFMSLRDVRPEVTADGSFRTKYMANHYLSFNVSKRLNLGFFENVIWENENDRGVDLNYLNPVIFYRAIEFSTGSRGGNALIGLSAKYKFSDRFNAYAQVIIDEFSVDAITGRNKSYKNKQGVQLGVKYYDAFAIKNLQLQLEFNQVRPYVYSNNEITLNYGHNNQSMAHLWGASFSEFIAIARYERDRWYGTGKVIYGKRGFETGNINDVYYGGSIYGNDENRPADTGNFIGQGNETTTFLGNLEVGYLLNPATNLKLYTTALYRSNKTVIDDPVNLEEQTLWINLGFRTDLFNWYFDY
ncbi:MAG TPA: gliding motility protein RemB [Leeuwenhoekiella sp.]|nr:gliding motility protein RemB [Leeuwenhoekiella sp.]